MSSCYTGISINSCSNPKYLWSLLSLNDECLTGEFFLPVSSVIIVSGDDSNAWIGGMWLRCLLWPDLFFFGVSVTSSS